ncbi:MAG: ATP-binding protein [Treponema sp.]|nr:ATP-binding protein [Treponema sp.]
MNNKNYMRDLMLTGFELSRISGVPMLYLGNPGMGKTTIVNLWAKRNGYHVESLIGSAFDRSEILGYMVNDGAGTDYLRTKAPEWFHTITELEKNGVPSVLFIDEIAGAPKDVQASLYRLIFERTIGNGQKLPESTIIASASNYKNNLPPMRDITAPNLNRFCVINFGPLSFQGLYSEFLQEADDLEKDLPDFAHLELSKETKEKANLAVRGIFEKINTTYNVKVSSPSQLNFANKRLNNVFTGDYSKNGEVYNFISGRTIGYFRDIFLAMYSIGLNNPFYISKFVDGLIGLGFNSFSDIQELNAFRKFVRELTKDALKELNGKKKKQKSFSYNSKLGIAENVNTLLDLEDKLEAEELEEACMEIVPEIEKAFKTDSESLSQLPLINKMPKEVRINLRNDYSAIEIFYLLAEKCLSSSEKDEALSKLNNIITSYKFYINSCIQTEAA